MTAANGVPGRWTIVGGYFVFLWRGILRDEIRVRAASALISRSTCWHWQGVESYNDTVAKLRLTMAERTR